MKPLDQQAVRRAKCMTGQQAADVRRRLARFASLERRDTDEIGWIALAYSCSREKAEKMIAEANETKPA